MEQGRYVGKWGREGREIGRLVRGVRVERGENGCSKMGKGKRESEIENREKGYEDEKGLVRGVGHGRSGREWQNKGGGVGTRKWKV